MKQVFVCGCGRSGTTLLGAMLGSHSRCIATPESKFLMPAYRSMLLSEGDSRSLEPALSRLVADWSFRVWGIEAPSVHELSLAGSTGSDSFPALVDHLVARYGQNVGKPDAEVWVDHTPGNMRRAAALNEMFPEARLIHLIRDGRAVASSVKPLDWGPNTAGAAARWWVDGVAMGFAASEFFGQRSISVRFEDLVLEPDVWMKLICEFLELEYEPGMVSGSGFQIPRYTRQQHDLVGRPPDAERIEAWRYDLTHREIEIFESIATDFLSGLGYEPIQGLASRPRSVWERMSQLVRELAHHLVINPLRRRRRIKRSEATRAGKTRGRGS